ncbi:hypothetical protein LWI29_018609 [Acer saccharum]|uniref:Uncharacterized protein n=1 Tax=Acer saccharum TaxID=4024 RepID=A0AA39RI69_ACESA|nr:hypothetical protein LWI29_018609 [Acer saccharum]
MKFGKEFKKRKVPEWTDAYLDYNGLKRILREILLYKLSKQPPTPLRDLHQKLKLRRSFSGLHAQSRNPIGKGDIEDQVIDVKRLPRDGSGHFYKTDFLRQSEEGGEIEISFFRKLDQELNKVNTFYKDKVEAVISEAAELNKQMDALIALRIKVERKNPYWDNLTAMPLRSDTRSTPRTPGTGHMTEPEVEMSDRTRQEESLDTWSDNAASETSGLTLGVDMSDNYQVKESTGGPEDDRAPTTNYSSYDTEEENINKSKEDSLEILEHVKINNTLESPMSTIKGVFKDSKDDELRFKKEELKKVEDQLKHVFIEFYQKLLLLKHYSSMNLAAFSKIMKKYEKITSRRASRSYIKIVDNSYLGSSDEVNGLLERVEATFINHFSNSNRREGMKLLRPKAKREKHSVTFLSGFFSGCFIALLVAVVLRIEARNLMDKEGALYMVKIFPLYSLFAYVVLHMLMYASDIYFWRRYRVNYPFIFGFKQGTELGYREVFLLSTGLAVLALISLLANFAIGHGLKSSALQEIDSTHSSVFYYSKILAVANFSRSDFFLADNLTSQVQAIRSTDLYICYYGLGEYSQRQEKCHSHGVYNTLYSVVAVIPFWLRFLQCLRRLCEEKDAVHVYNGLKYFLIIVAVLIRTAFELKKGRTWLVLALISSACAIAMSTYWDIVVDWGLLRRKSKNPYLRDKLVISNKSVYFVAMVLNILLRIAWMQLVLEFNLHSLHKLTITTVVSCLEIIRRGIWNFFRVENEHLNNVGKYRAFKSVPLPFSYYDDDKETDKDD